MHKLPKDILALDLGTNLGWSFAREGVIEASGTICLMTAGDLPGRRFIKFHNWLNKFAGVDMVFYESVGAVGKQKSAASVKVNCGLLALLEMFCCGGRIPLKPMHLMTLKKAITGTGKAQKEQMCRVMHQLGWQNGRPGTMIDDDESDACCLVFAILDTMGHTARFKGSDLDYQTFQQQSALIR